MRKWLMLAGSLMVLWLLLWGAISVRMATLPAGRGETVTCMGYRFGYWMVLPFAFFLYPLEPLRITAHAGLATAVAVGLFALLLVLVEKRRKHRGAFPPSPGGSVRSRRAFLARNAGRVLGVATVGMAADAIALAPQRIQARRYRIPIRGLPDTLDGLRIVQLSDTHYGPFVTLNYLREVIRQANAEMPDVVVLTGDYVHQSPMAIRAGIEIFGELRARHATVAVLGNHDHWEGADACRAEFQKLGIPMLDNRRRFFARDGFVPAPNGECLCLAGVGDLWEDEVLIARTLADVPQEMPRIVLSHNPDVAEVAPRDERIDLMLSGHTHGGQVWLPGFGTPKVPSFYGQKYAGGLVEAPTCQVIVSRGVGMAILPVRFFVPPEFSVITLSRALPRG